MRKLMIAFVGAAFVLAAGATTFLPTAALANEKTVSKCAKETDAKKKAECVKHEADAAVKAKAKK